jgi:hypothetical protein
MRGKWRRYFFVVVALGCAAGFLFSWATLNSDRHDSNLSADCDPSAAPSASHVENVPIPSPAPSATFKAGQVTSVAFGRSTSTKHLVLLLTLTSKVRGLTSLQARPDPFLRSDDAPLNQQDIFITSTVEGTNALVDVCFDRSGDELGGPGTYIGSVTLTDPHLAAQVTIPMTATMQYVHGGFLLWLVAAAIIPGAWLLWISKTSPSDRPTFFVGWAWFDWMLEPAGLIAVVTGSVAAFSVYVATYLKNPTWGASAYQSIALYGAMFSAFIATSHIAYAGSSHARGSHDTHHPAQSQPAPPGPGQ